MKPTLITVKNEIGREMSPFSIIKKQDYYPAPGIEDGEHLAELKWQYYDMWGKKWVNVPHEKNIEIFKAEQFQTQAIWVKAIDAHILEKKQ